MGFVDGGVGAGVSRFGEKLNCDIQKLFAVVRQ